MATSPFDLVGIDALLSDEERAIRDTVRRFADEQIRPHIADWFEEARIPARDARVVLLSDCLHNAGPDPRPVAGRLPRLDVLLDESGEKDLELGRELATAGRGRFARIRTYRDVAPALQRAFAD